MKDMIRLTDLQADDIYEIFQIADEISAGKYSGFLGGKSVVLFFPTTSIRTRVTFEKGIWMLGGQPILFPGDVWDKREETRDVFGYLNNWADLIMIRHKDIRLLEEAAKYAEVPIINAMTDVNHPCEILSDLYALSKRREDFIHDKYLFCGKSGNIGLAWKEASEVMNFKNCQVTEKVMDMANKNALLNPCPPFYRGEEVSADAIESDYFVGYGFKKSLLSVQQAVMVWCLREV